MSNVMITPNKTTGKLVTPYEGNPEFGYVTLTQTFNSIGLNGWGRTEKRVLNYRSKVTDCEAFVAAHKSKGLVVDGNLIVKEFAESQTPELYKDFFFDKKLSYEENVAKVAKRAGTDGPYLTTQDGERILRFTIISQDPEDKDVKVQHANTGAVKSYNAALKGETASAAFPS